LDNVHVLLGLLGFQAALFKFQRLIVLLGGLSPIGKGVGGWGGGAANGWPPV